MSERVPDAAPGVQSATAAFPGATGVTVLDVYDWPSDAARAYGMCGRLHHLPGGTGGPDRLNAALTRYHCVSVRMRNDQIS